MTRTNWNRSDVLSRRMARQCVHAGIPDLQWNVRFPSDPWPDFAAHPITMGADAIWSDPVHNERHNWLDW